MLKFQLYSNKLHFYSESMYFTIDTYHNTEKTIITITIIFITVIYHIFSIIAQHYVQYVWVFVKNVTPCSTGSEIVK